MVRSGEKMGSRKENVRESEKKNHDITNYFYNQLVLFFCSTAYLFLTSTDVLSIASAKSFRDDASATSTMPETPMVST